MVLISQQEIYKQNVSRMDIHEIAKSFDQSALVSEDFFDISSLKDLNFSLLKNGEIVQQMLMRWYLVLIK